MTDIQTEMGTIIIIFITTLAVIDGVALTYLAIERAPLSARFCAGAILGLALLSWVGLLISLVFGLNIISIGLTVITLMIGLIVLHNLVTPAHLLDELKSFSPSKVSIIYYFAWTALLALLFSRVVMFYPHGMHTAPANNFGDLPFHFSAITSFAYGENLPPQTPIFSGIKFTYPFLIDFLTAFFMRCGADWRSAFFVENIVLSFSLVVLIGYMTIRLVGNTIASRIAPVIFFFNGGFGFINFFTDFRQFFNDPSLARTGLVSFLTNLPKTYTMNTDLPLSVGNVPLRWGNVFTTLIIPQRSMLFGLPFVAMIITLWWIALRECGMRNAECGIKNNEDLLLDKSAFRIPHSAFRILSAAGLLAGLLPMLHAHGFFAVMIASVPMALLFWSRQWLWFFIPAVALAGPQALWLSGTQVKNKLFELHLWWEAGVIDPLIFWAVNAGVFLILLLAAFIYSRQKRFYLPFFLWLIVPNLVLLAPWPWDNIKVLVYWSLAFCPLAAMAPAYLFTHRSVVFRAVAAVLLVMMTFSGALDVLRALSPAENVRLFGKDELEVANLLRHLTPPRSIILHAPIHNSVVSLTGRQSVMGYPGHLWTHGIDYKQRETEVDSIYRGAPETGDILSRLNIDYVVIGPVERSQLTVDESYFERLYSRVIDHAGYRVYRVK